MKLYNAPRVSPGEIEPSSLLPAKDETDDRNPKTNAARDKALLELRETVAQRREAERRSATIARQVDVYICIYIYVYIYTNSRPQ